MQRLLKDAGKLTGKKYDIKNLSDVYEAIHVIQKEMGVTGTTAKEASTTFLGSFNAMKASAKNLLGAFATGENIQPALEGLVSSTVTFIGGNLLPMVGTILASIIQMIIDNIGKVPSLIDNLGNIILSKAPSILSAGLMLITQLAVAIIKATPKITVSMVTLLVKAVASLLKGIFKFREAGEKWITNATAGIRAKFSAVTGAIGNLATKAVGKFKGYISQFKNAGMEIVRGLWSGASGMVAWAVSKFAGLGKSILGGIKRALGIKSPSKVFADAVGKMIPLGIAEGVKKNASAVNDALTGMMADAMPSVQAQLNGFANRRTAVPGVANSIVNGMATLQGASGGQQIAFRPTIYLWPNGAKAGKDLYEIQTEWGNRLNG
jgi:phage-related protein